MLAKLSLCRTSVLGGRWYKCNDCDQLTKLHNSCGDRHCPHCSGAKRRQFSDRASKLLLEGVKYYQVVFTLPAILSTLALANRRQIADLLFDSAWKALKKTIRVEQGYDPAALMVLHSWNQKLDSHWHVHALVPGGGLSLENGGWTEATAPPSLGDARNYLVDAINLRTSFRKFAISHLRRLRRSGKLKFGGSLAYLRCDDAWDAMVQELGQTDWVSHIEPPRGESSRPEHIVRYLTRYLTGGPISDYRIISADDHEVSFMAREGKAVGGEEIQVPYTLKTPEFVRRWCLHIQPNQLTKIRYFGGWSNKRRERYLERCAIALECCAGYEIEGEIDFDPKSLEEAARPAACDDLVCEHCGSVSLILVNQFDKPSWKDVLSRRRTTCPEWYAVSQKLDDRRFWDARMGEGFSDWYDWYLESPIEGAREPDPPDRPVPAQLFLPGMQEPGISTTHTV